MSSRLLREFSCDYMYGKTIACTEEIIIPTGSMSYGADESKERNALIKAGWKYVNEPVSENSSALKLYCPLHTTKVLNDAEA